MSEEPTWKRRVVERLLQPAKLRAEQRVYRFLDAAQALVIEKGRVDFTVQELVTRSHQSLRDFYVQFDGKQDLLLTLWEDTLRRTAEQLRAAAENVGDPLEKLRLVVELLFELCRPDPAAQRPLFTDFGPRMLILQPKHTEPTYGPMVNLIAELMEQAQRRERMRTDIDPYNAATLTVQTVMFTARSTATIDEQTQHPITAEEIWGFCAFGFECR